MKSLLAITLAGLTGCYSMAPAYERPTSPVQAQLPGGAGDQSAADVPWHEFIRDAHLRAIIDQALVNNRDLRKAALNIDSARAQYRIQRSQLFPAIDATAAFTSARTIITDDNKTLTSTAYSATVGLTAWEIDLFGRIKSLTDAQKERFLAQMEVARATRIGLIAEIATAYVTMAADKSRLQIANETMASGKRTMELTEALVGGGTSNRGDFYQASTVYEQARADVAALTAAIAQDKNALELLVGAPLGDDLLPPALPEQLDWFADVPVGLSSNVLLVRPDVLAAEHALKAANANIGAARAQFFPSLSLTANGGIASVALAALFTGPAAVFTLAPALAVPLFRGGANQANLDDAKVQKLIATSDYEHTIQTAFRETSDALATRATIKEQLEAQTALVQAATKGLELAKARYEGGVETFLTTLVSERALYGAKSGLVATQVLTLGSRVTLYRVLGGGLK